MIKDTTPFISNFCRLDDEIEIGEKTYKVIRLAFLTNDAYATRPIETGVALVILTPRQFREGSAVNKSRSC